MEAYEEKSRAYKNDFLLFSYFGIVQRDIDRKSDKEVVEICARRAYLDLSRRVGYAISVSVLNDWRREPSQEAAAEAYEKDKELFKAEVVEYLSDRIVEYLGTVRGSEDGGDFDGWHRGTCDAILEKSKRMILEADTGLMDEGRPFSYGLAQKWVNMTLKYMMILCRWNQEFEIIHRIMHIPIDSSVLEAAKDLPGVPKMGSSWSAIESYETYRHYQEMLREALDGKQSPIEWEGDVWTSRQPDKKGQGK